MLPDNNKMNQKEFIEKMYNECKISKELFKETDSILLKRSKETYKK